MIAQSTRFHSLGTSRCEIRAFDSRAWDMRGTLSYSIVVMCLALWEGEKWTWLAWWGILSVLDYLLFLCLIILVIYFQPAARKGADKSGPGAGFTVLSEKTLFLGQKVSIWHKMYFSNSSKCSCISHIVINIKPWYTEILLSYCKKTEINAKPLVLSLS